MNKPGTENYRGTEVPGSALSPRTRADDYQEIMDDIENVFPNSKVACSIALAIATSGVHENRVPLWIFFVGPPSSGKTDLVSLFRPIPDVYFLDSMTLNSFISGERSGKDEKKVHDLLPLLDKKCFIVKDWTVIFSLDEQTAKKIIGDMVGAYDKFLSKFSATRGRIEYNSEFSQIGCITPATLNHHHNYLNMLGPRFLSYRIPEPSDEQSERSFSILFDEENNKTPTKRSNIVAQLVIKISKYMELLNQIPLHIDPLSRGVQDFLKISAKFTAKSRGIVVIQASEFRNEAGENISYYEPLEVQIEHPWRAIQQLISLAKYLAFVAGKTEVGLDECRIIKEIVLSSMPADRSDAMKVIQTNGIITAKELSEMTEKVTKSTKSIKTARRLLDELCFLGICIKTKDNIGQMASTYEIVPEFRDYVCVDTGEFLSAYSN